MRLVMTLKVRDEADILEANLRYHHALGVDFFIATDNGSVDGTAAVLHRYRQAGLLHLMERPGDDFLTEEANWVTHMARLAATDFRADWVLNVDADEFWWPLAGDLKQALETIPERYGAVIAPRPELVPRPDGPGSFAERLIFRETRSRALPKVAHRGVPDLVTGGGSHQVGRASDDLDQLKLRFTRPVYRHVDPEAYLAPGNGSLVPAPRWPLRVLHVPFRSFAQFTRRVDAALRSPPPTSRRRHRLRAQLGRLREQGKLRELYERIVFDDARVEQELRDGSLVLDTSLRETLARYPDPLDCGGDQPTGQRALRAGAGSTARCADGQRDADHEYDAMQAMAAMDRLMRAQGAKQARTVAKLQADLEAQREKLRGTLAKLERCRQRLGAPEGGQGLEQAGR